MAEVATAGNGVESQTIPSLLSNTLAADIINERRNAIGSINQTAADSRNCATAGLNTLVKRTSELDAVEASAVNPILGHNAQYASASGSSMQNAQLANSLAALQSVVQSMATQQAQLLALVGAKAA
jgi:hypothetical protein